MGAGGEPFEHLSFCCHDNNNLPSNRRTSASIEGDKFTIEQVKEIVGEKFDQAAFDAVATDGFVTKEQINSAVSAAASEAVGKDEY